MRMRYQKFYDNIILPENPSLFSILFAILFFFLISGILLPFFIIFIVSMIGIILFGCCLLLIEKKPWCGWICRINNSIANR